MKLHRWFSIQFFIFTAGMTTPPYASTPEVMLDPTATGETYTIDTVK